MNETTFIISISLWKIFPILIFSLLLVFLIPNSFFFSNLEKRNNLIQITYENQLRYNEKSLKFNAKKIKELNFKTYFLITFFTSFLILILWLLILYIFIFVFPDEKIDGEKVQVIKLWPHLLTFLIVVISDLIILMVITIFIRKKEFKYQISNDQLLIDFSDFCHYWWKQNGIDKSVLNLDPNLLKKIEYKSKKWFQKIKKNKIKNQQFSSFALINLFRKYLFTFRKDFLTINNSYDYILDNKKDFHLEEIKKNLIHNFLVEVYNMELNK